MSYLLKIAKRSADEWDQTRSQWLTNQVVPASIGAGLVGGKIGDDIFADRRAKYNPWNLVEASNNKFAPSKPPVRSKYIGAGVLGGLAAAAAVSAGAYAYNKNNFKKEAADMGFQPQSQQYDRNKSMQDMQVAGAALGFGGGAASQLLDPSNKLKELGGRVSDVATRAGSKIQSFLKADPIQGRMLKAGVGGILAGSAIGYIHDKGRNEVHDNIYRKGLPY